ncbi:SNF2 family N-terminal domain-containing protein [Hypoxylon crocopeplum]|nr:SNF2 family N-terminal domain-containing protein [Hypoxylon crocopeplum]
MQQSTSLSRTLQETLDETMQSRIRGILDMSSGPESFKEVHPSARMKVKLMDHQKKALAMMIEKERGLLKGNEFPTLWEEFILDGDPNKSRYYNTVTRRSQSKLPELCLGGILADDMGLGKTLSTLTLITTSTDEHNRDEAGSSLPPTLIVVPLAVLSNWEVEIKKHFQPNSVNYIVYHGPKRKTILETIHMNEIVLTTYETLKIDISASDSALFRDRLWNRIVLDEAHLVRNQSSQGFKAVKQLRATHRWCLTGTPVQNRVEDFGALLDFLRVYPFDDPSVFKQSISLPIRKAEELGFANIGRLFQAVSLRRVKTAVNQEIRLGTRQEIMERVQLDADEQRIYDIVRNAASRSIDVGRTMQNVLQAILKLRQISNHGRALLSSDTVEWLDNASRLEGAEEAAVATCENCCRSLKMSRFGEISSLQCLHQVCSDCLNSQEMIDDSQNKNSNPCPVCVNDRTPSTKEGGSVSPRLLSIPVHFKDKSDAITYSPSSKIRALLRNLRQDGLGHSTNAELVQKSVVFSSWTKMLDLVEMALKAEGLVFARIDGSKSRQCRDSELQTFRADSTCNVLLATIGSAGLGLDLSFASRVHILEPQWNPMAERQALDRVYRIGQTREVVSYQYIATGIGSIDEYMLKVQEKKIMLVEASFGSGAERQNAILKDLVEHLRGSIEV